MSGVIYTNGFENFFVLDRSSLSKFEVNVFNQLKNVRFVEVKLTIFRIKRGLLLDLQAKLFHIKIA